MFEDGDSPVTPSDDWGGGHTLNVEPPSGFMTTRERIMADPGLRLSFNIEQLKAKQQSEAIDVKRHTDQAVMPLILDDAKKNQEHMDHLNESIVEFTKKMEHPYPIREAAQLGTGDTLGIGLAALFGGRVSDAAGAAYKNNQARSDIDYENRVNQYGATRQENEQVLARLQREMQEAQAHGDRLEETRIGEAGHQEDVARAEIEKAKDRFAKATNPGEVQQAADDLKKLGETVSDQAIADAKKSVGLKEHKQDMSDAAQEYAAIVGQIDRYGGTSGPQVDQLDGLVQQINSRYGTNYPPVVGGMTWKASNAKDQNTYREKVQKVKEAEFEKSLKIRDKEATAHIAEWAANREFQTQRLAIERTRANADMLRATNDKGIQTAKTRLASVKAQLDSVNADLARGGLDKKRRAALYGRRDSLRLKLEGYQAGLDYMQRASAGDESATDGTGDLHGSIGSSGTSIDPSTSAEGVTKSGTKWRAH